MPYLLTAVVILGLWGLELAMTYLAVKVALRQDQREHPESYP